MAKDQNDDKKIRRLAEAAMFYRGGVSELVERGYDPDQLDADVAAMEEVLDEEQVVQQKRQKTRRLVRTL